MLKPDGTVWINLGDTYNGVKQGNTSNKGYQENTIIDTWRKPKSDLPNKCLLLIPHRFAIGCIDRGWTIRNDVIWAKRNALPESVKDRFSKKHEYIFLITKQPNYYFDLDSVRGPHLNGELAKLNSRGKNPGSVSDFWNIPIGNNSAKHYAAYSPTLIDKPIKAGCPEGGVVLDPFCGTGTTGERTIILNRRFIGIDAKQEYIDIALPRIQRANLESVDIPKREVKQVLAEGQGTLFDT